GARNLDEGGDKRLPARGERRPGELRSGGRPVPRRGGGHRCAAGDAFSHPDYLATLAAEGETPLAAVFADRSGSHVLYAFLLREG
ncbi:hypothetical protein J8J17_24640, partial [Mycobacterium tuberculosis]|nr:hypothetical protein [Mycobacterium tuberculosis]